MSMRATVRPRGGVSLKNMDRAALKRLVGYIMRRKGMLAGDRPKLCVNLP